ncbi:MAG: hypothetical protein ACRDRA_05330 [Pseudonocardiaceae bacterium]
MAACTRERAGGWYCLGHANRWKRARNADPDLDERWFRRTASAIAERNIVSLRGLGQRVVLEFVYGLQQRCAGGSKTALHAVRPLLDRARLVQVESLRELPVEGMSVPARALRNELVKLIERFETDPETERVKDRWNLAAFGHRGSLQFGEISQAWLREATKAWAFAPPGGSTRSSSVRGGSCGPGSTLRARTESVLVSVARARTGSDVPSASTYLLTKPTDHRERNRKPRPISDRQAR